MYLADTNVLSELLRPQPNENVVAWVVEHDDLICTSAITVKELNYGVNVMDDGRRKQRLKEAVSALMVDYADKTYGFDAFCGYICAQMEVEAWRAGVCPSVEDLMIAAICQRNELTLVTRNVKDFSFLDIPVVNPFDA